MKKRSRSSKTGSKKSLTLRRKQVSKKIVRKRKRFMGGRCGPSQVTKGGDGPGRPGS